MMSFCNCLCNLVQPVLIYGLGFLDSFSRIYLLENNVETFRLHFNFNFLFYMVKRLCALANSLLLRVTRPHVGCANL